MNTLQFSDHLVPYEMFIKDLASQIVRFLKEDSNESSLKNIFFC